jgi:hypothetical protein
MPEAGSGVSCLSAPAARSATRLAPWGETTEDRRREVLPAARSAAARSATRLAATEVARAALPKDRSFLQRGHSRQEREVAVVVQYRDSMPYRAGGDQAIDS